MPTRPPVHRPLGYQPPVRSQQLRDRAYDANRGTPAERGYTRAWSRLRAVVLAREPLCRSCLALGRLVQATAVHHIVEVADAPELRMVEANLAPICAACHMQEHARRRKAI